jgi:hypothetical protein
MSDKRRIIHLSRGQDLLEDLYDELQAMRRSTSSQHSRSMILTRRLSSGKRSE